MFDVLAFVYQHYWHGEACPEAALLQRKLNAQGFDSEDIGRALHWLDGLSLAAQHVPPDDAPLPGMAAMTAPTPGSLRIYSTTEQDHLGAQALGFVCFLESAGVLPASLREMVVDRAMAAPGGPIALEELKIIVLMVYWRLGLEPDALVLDELCDDSEGRLPH